MKFGRRVGRPACYKISSGFCDPDHSSSVTAPDVAVGSGKRKSWKKVAVTQKLAEIGGQLLLLTDRNSHMSFQVVTLDSTSSDPEGSNRDFGRFDCE